MMKTHGIRWHSPRRHRGARMHNDPPNGCALADDDAQDTAARAHTAETRHQPMWRPGPTGEWRGAGMREMRGTHMSRRGRHWLPWVAGGCLLIVGLAVLACALVIGALAGLAIHFANFREAQSSITR